MAEVLWDIDAESDLREIWGYIASDSSTAADRLLDAIFSKAELMATQPELGQLRPELAPGLRSFLVGNYVVFYRPWADGIVVARVIHGARDVEAEF
jgi:toxin ParE1/3/4